LEDLSFYKNLVENHGSPLIIFYKNRLIKNYNNLKNALPNVVIHYAIKSNSNPLIVKTLNDIGSSFDVASSTELKYCLKDNVPISNILYTHPIKTKEEILFFKNNKINTFVIDNISEIEKLSENDNILIRIKPVNIDCKHNLSKKFGCDISDIFNISNKIRQNNMNLIGICFHVGSQTLNPTPYLSTLKILVNIYKKLEKSGFNLSILDIGGGFPNSWDNKVDIFEFCSPIREYLKNFDKYKIIAEPGRFLVSDTCESIFSIIGKNYRNNKLWYYVDEGIYNSFSDIIYDKISYPIYDLYKQEKEICILAGQTCDSIDVICKNIQLSNNLNYGDILISSDIGAYSSECASSFNGFLKTKYVGV